MKIKQLSFLFKAKSVHTPEPPSLEDVRNNEKPRIVRTLFEKPKRHIPSDTQDQKILGNDTRILSSIWSDLIDRYFPEMQSLKNYRMAWSNRRQTRCLASCNVEDRIVRVASPMKQPEARAYLEPLLYHELCHAVVGIKIVRGRRRMHTPDFKRLEKLHPGIDSLDAWIDAGGWAHVVRKDLVSRGYTKAIKKHKRKRNTFIRIIRKQYSLYLD